MKTNKRLTKSIGTSLARISDESWKLLKNITTMVQELGGVVYTDVDNGYCETYGVVEKRGELTEMCIRCLRTKEYETGAVYLFAYCTPFDERDEDHTHEIMDKGFEDLDNCFEWVEISKYSPTDMAYYSTLVNIAEDLYFYCDYYYKKVA